MKKILFLTGFCFVFIYVVFVLGMAFYPAPFKITEPVICPVGMVIDEETAKQNRSRKNSYIKCRSQDGEIADATGSTLLIGMAPLSIGLLLIIFSFRASGSRKDV